MRLSIIPALFVAQLFCVTASAQMILNLDSATRVPGAGVDVQVDVSAACTLWFNLYRGGDLIGQTAAVANSGGVNQEFRVLFSDPDDSSEAVKAQAGDEVTAEASPNNGDPDVESNGRFLT